MIAQGAVGRGLGPVGPTGRRLAAGALGVALALAMGRPVAAADPTPRQAQQQLYQATRAECGAQADRWVREHSAGIGPLAAGRMRDELAWGCVAGGMRSADVLVDGLATGRFSDADMDRCTEARIGGPMDSMNAAPRVTRALLCLQRMAPYQ